MSGLNSLVWLPLLAALFGPALIIRDGRFGRAALVAFAPALVTTVAWLVSIPTAWGHRTPNLDGSNSDNLEVAAAVLTFLGIVGFGIAAISTSVPRRPRRPPPPRPPSSQE